jgi:hypothetical protein
MTGRISRFKEKKMGAYHNALREEGSRSDLIRALEKAWAEEGRLRKQAEAYRRRAEKRDNDFDAENARMRKAAMPFIKAGEAFGEVRMSRDDTYLWVQARGDERDDVKISLADCDRLRDACVS